MKRWALLAGVLLLFSMAASAQDENPKAEVFGGYSLIYNNSTNFLGSSIIFNGGEGSMSYNPTSWLGLVGDFAGEHWSKGSADANVFTYLFGPKLAYRTDKVTAFGEVGFGGAHLSGSRTCVSGVVGVHPETAEIGCGSGSEDAFAMSAGGGLDYNLTKHIGIRPVQLDYVMTRFFSRTQNSLHYAAGIVFRW